MKVKMYLDLWPGIDPTTTSLIAYSKPPEKITGNRRIAFTIEIPDHLIYDYDALAVVVTNIEET
jgi:hypothetical protein